MSFNIEINEMQMSLIEKALNLLRAYEEFERTTNDEELEEVEIMIGLAGMTRVEEDQNPGQIHIWAE